MGKRQPAGAKRRPAPLSWSQRERTQCLIQCPVPHVYCMVRTSLFVSQPIGIERLCSVPFVLMVRDGWRVVEGQSRALCTVPLPYAHRPSLGERRGAAVAHCPLAFKESVPFAAILHCAATRPASHVGRFLAGQPATKGISPGDLRTR